MKVLRGRMRTRPVERREAEDFETSGRAGKVVTVNKQPRANNGFTKAQRRCASCAGAGLVADVRTPYQVQQCAACNGRGYVREWRKEQ